jgi:hypothetical protein
MVVGQASAGGGEANNNGKPKSAYGGRHINRLLGDENRSWLLVRRPPEADKLRQRRTGSARGGTSANNGREENRSWLLVRRSTTAEIENPGKMDDMVVGQAMRQRRTGSTTAIEADELRQRRTGPTTAIEADTPLSFQ